MDIERLKESLVLGANSNTISRREFLTDLGLFTASALLSACAKRGYEPESLSLVPVESDGTFLKKRWSMPVSEVILSDDQAYYWLNGDMNQYLVRIADSDGNQTYRIKIGNLKRLDRDYKDIRGTRYIVDTDVLSWFEPKLLDVNNGVVLVSALLYPNDANECAQQSSCDFSVGGMGIALIDAKSGEFIWKFNQWKTVIGNLDVNHGRINSNGDVTLYSLSFPYTYSAYNPDRKSFEYKIDGTSGEVKGYGEADFNEVIPRWNSDPSEAGTFDNGDTYRLETGEYSASHLKRVGRLSISRYDRHADVNLATLEKIPSWETVLEGPSEEFRDISGAVLYDDNDYLVINSSSFLYLIEAKNGKVLYAEDLIKTDVVFEREYLSEKTGEYVYIPVNNYLFVLDRTRMSLTPELHFKAPIVRLHLVGKNLAVQTTRDLYSYSLPQP